MSKTYVDTNGYLRYSDSDKLVHRHVALKKLYNNDKYPLKFGEYQVHHIDRNKLNVTIQIPFFSVKPANTGNITLIQQLWN